MGIDVPIAYITIGYGKVQHLEEIGVDMGEKKMRLIDADKLVEICRKGWRLFGYHDEKLKHWVDEYDIRSQPTVKAIPIEWIKEYASMKSFNDEMDCYWHFWEEDLLQMIEQWEKENGLL